MNGGASSREDEEANLGGSSMQLLICVDLIQRPHSSQSQRERKGLERQES